MGYYATDPNNNLITYSDPVTGELVNAFQAFQSYLSQDSLYLEANDSANRWYPGERVLRLKFSTASRPAGGGLLSFNRWNEKLRYIRIAFQGATKGGLDGIQEATLIRGGTGLIRTQYKGTADPDPEKADQCKEDLTEYSTRHWFYGPDGWDYTDGFESSIDAQVFVNSAVPDETFKENTFEELSAAATDWTLMFPVNGTGPGGQLDISNMVDIEVHLNFWYYTRLDPGGALCATLF